MSEKIIKIAAFTTNEITQNAMDILEIFLEQQIHKIIKKTETSVEFSFSTKNTKIDSFTFYTISDLSKEYIGIDSVNFYVIFFDLENEESSKKT